MKLKEVDRTAMQAWSPAHNHPIYLATGKLKRSVDASNQFILFPIYLIHICLLKSGSSFILFVEPFLPGQGTPALFDPRAQWLHSVFPQHLLHRGVPDACLHTQICPASQRFYLYSSGTRWHIKDPVHISVYMNDFDSLMTILTSGFMWK